MSDKNKDIIKNLILLLIILFGLFTIIASGGSSSSSVSNTTQPILPPASNNEEPDKKELNDVSIISPNDSSSYKSGSTINFIGAAHDYTGDAISGIQMVWTSDKDQTLGTGQIVEKILSDGEHEITLRATDDYGNLATAKLLLTIEPGAANEQPSEVTIEEPESKSFSPIDYILFKGNATDPEDGILTGQHLTWFSTLDNEIGNGEFFTLDTLSKGVHTIALIAEDSNGLQKISETVDITVENQKPEAVIEHPDDGGTFTFTAGNQIVFQGKGTDHEDGDLPDSNLTWRSSIDKFLGKGKLLPVDTMTSGEHKISFTVTDKDGGVDTAVIYLTINP
jgi:hypothetical protein